MLPINRKYNILTFKIWVISTLARTLVKKMLSQHTFLIHIYLLFNQENEYKKTVKKLIEGEWDLERPLVEVRLYSWLQGLYIA